MEAPLWWYLITAAFAILGSLAVIALIVAVLVLIKKMQELQPKVQAMGDRIDRIGERVERISESIEGIAGSAKGTVESVAGGANSLIRSLTSMGSQLESGLAKFTPLFVGLKLAQAAYATFTARKKGKNGTIDVAALPAKTEANRR